MDSPTSPKSATRSYRPRRREPRYALYIHAVVVVIVVICATVLGYIRVLNSGDVLAVYTGAIGFAAGRAPQRGQSRQSDQ